MPLSFYSWEVLALFNIAFILLLPFSRKGAFSILLIPPAGMLLQKVIGWNQGDLWFYFRLLFLHLYVSAANLFCFDEALRKLDRRWAMLPILTASLLMSTSLFFFTPSVQWIDPFWGVLPGMVLLDEAFTWSPYWFRLYASLPVWMLFLYQRSYALSLPIALPVFALMASFIVPNPFSFRSQLAQQFDETTRVKNLHLYIQNPHGYKFDPHHLAKEVAYRQKYLLQKLPESELELPEFHLFFYRDSYEKLNLIGAGNVQLGLFYRSEMHFSDLQPHESLLQHELSHLIHGALNAPLYSYLNPFIFEGFAEALSKSARQNQTEAAALLQTHQLSRLKDWPKWFQFSQWPPSVSYRLAAGSSSWLLEQGLQPWQQAAPLKELQKQEVSKELIEKAKSWVEQPLYLHEPQRQDCARLHWKLHQDATLMRIRRYRQYCEPTDLRQNVEIEFADLSTKKKALAYLNDSESQGDLKLLNGDTQNPYTSCQTLTCRLKGQWFEEDAESLKTFIESAQINSSELLKQFSSNEAALETLIQNRPFHEIPLLLRNLEMIRELEPEERRLKYETAFYRAFLMGKQNEAKQIARKAKKAKLWKKDTYFTQRIEWELSNRAEN